MMRIVTPCSLLLVLLSAINAYSLSMPVSYTLYKGAQVSVAVYDAGGRMVRELARAEPQTAGRHILYWDGLDQAGRAMPRGNYHWRLLQTRGLQAEYLFSLGTCMGDLPWPGQHGGPAAVAVAGESIYMAASSANGAPQAVRFTCDGVYQRAYPSPEPGAIVSAIALGGGNLYLLCANSGLLYALDPASGVIRNTLNLRLPEFGGTPERLAANEHTLLAACPSSGNLCWLDPETGKVQATVTVEKLGDITLQPDGQVFAISGESIVTLSRANTDPRIVISNLTAPTRVCFDAASHDLLIVEGGDHWQIKRYNQDMELVATYGRAGGRQQGRYHAEDFLAVSGIAADGTGGFVVTEGGAAPPRTAHFDAHGALLREWYGGQDWGCTAVADPANPEYLWFDAQGGWLVQATVDYRHRTWRPYASYRYAGLADGQGAETPLAPGGWQVRHHGKLTYLLHAQGFPCLLRVDEAAGCLVPEMWTDLDGNGALAPAEGALTPWRATGTRWDIDDGFGFLATSLPKAAKGYEIRSLSPRWRQNLPHYPFLSATTTRKFPADASKLNPAAMPVPIDGCRDAHGNNYLILRGGGDGYVAPAFYPPPYGCAWPAGGNDANAVVKWDAHGNTLWRVGAHATRPAAPRGLLYAPVRFAGMVNGCIGVCDRIAQPCEFWTSDGLYVGGVFDHRARDGRPAHDYAWWRTQPEAANALPADPALLAYDMFSGGALFTRANGEVLFLGAGWNNCPLYRLRGWEEFSRQHGGLRVRDEGRGAEGAGVGLHAAYYAGDDVRAAPAYEDTALGVWYDAQKPWPTQPVIAHAFTTRWTGQLEARFSEETTLAVYASGGVRLWLDGKLLIDHPESGGRFYAVPVRLHAGQRYRLRLLLRQTTGTPEAHLCWESLSQPIEHIPACYLYPTE